MGWESHSTLVLRNVHSQASVRLKEGKNPKWVDLGRYTQRGEQTHPFWVFSQLRVYAELASHHHPTQACLCPWCFPPPSRNLCCGWGEAWWGEGAAVHSDHANQGLCCSIFSPSLACFSYACSHTCLFFFFFFWILTLNFTLFFYFNSLDKWLFNLDLPLPPLCFSFSWILATIGVLTRVLTDIFKATCFHIQLEISCKLFCGQPFLYAISALEHIAYMFLLCG